MIIQLKHDVTGNQFSRIETCLGEYGFAASRKLLLKVELR